MVGLCLQGLLNVRLKLFELALALPCQRQSGLQIRLGLRAGEHSTGEVGGQFAVFSLQQQGVCQLGHHIVCSRTKVLRFLVFGRCA